MLDTLVALLSTSILQGFKKSTVEMGEIAQTREHENLLALVKACANDGEEVRGKRIAWSKFGGPGGSVSRGSHGGGCGGNLGRKVAVEVLGQLYGWNIEFEPTLAGYERRAAVID